MLCLGIESTAHTFGCSVVDSRERYSLMPVMSTRHQREAVYIHVASRHHMEVSPDILRNALKSANVTMKDIDIVGTVLDRSWAMFARWCSDSKDSCRILQEARRTPVNHALGHIELEQCSQALPTACAKLKSGGHTMILAFSLIAAGVFGETLDITVGQLLDQFGRSSGLPPLWQQDRTISKPVGWKIRSPYIIKGNDVSFSGLLTAAALLHAILSWQIHATPAGNSICNVGRGCRAGPFIHQQERNDDCGWSSSK